ncbi:MAG: hypothetical protein HPY85_16590 [Anaerolineae bacterium]|nr:hypothetical protein [Anaerolineae bacterium]
MFKKIIPVVVLTALLVGGCNLTNLGGEQPVAVPSPTIALPLPTQEVAEEEAMPTSIEVIDPTATQEPTAVTVEEEEADEEEVLEEEPTAEATREAVPTNTPQPTPTNTAVPLTGDPGVDNGKENWKEDFKNPAAAAVIQDEDWFSKGAVADGALVFTGKQSQVPAWRMAGTGDGMLGKAYVEAIIQNGTCNSGSDSSGLYFRVPNINNPTQGYLFGLNCEGYFYLWRWNGTALPKGEMQALIPLTFSEKANVGTDLINRLGVITNKAGRMILYINGSPVAEYTSDTYPDGYFGVFVRPASANPFTVKVDQLAMWKNPVVPTEKFYSPSATNEDEGEINKFNFASLLEDPMQDPGIVLGEPTWRDYLNSSANWGAFMNDYAITTGNQDGQLVMIGLKKESAWVLSSAPKLADGAVEVVMETEKCQMWDSYGIMFRVPVAAEGDRGYLFGVTCNGYYFLWKWDGKSDKMTTLIDYTKDVSAINYNSGARNRLDMVMVGSTLQLYANGVYLASYTDSTFTEGSWGVFVRPQYTDQFTVYLDEASYWINKPAE